MEKAWKYKTKEEYEKALEDMINSADSQELDEESYDFLLEEYIEFCTSEG